MSGGIKSRRKGCRFELAIARLLQDADIGAEIISRAGYPGGDISVPLLGIERTIECKSRGGTGFAQLYGWLNNRDLLIVRRDRSDPLVILPLRLAVEIASAAERKRAW